MFDTLIMFLKDIFEKVNFEKKSADDNKNMKTITQHAKSLFVYSGCFGSHCLGSSSSHNGKLCVCFFVIR